MSLSRHTLGEFTKGWFIGNFDPTLFKTDDVEIAVKRYKKGDSESAHRHKIATEYTLVISGRVEMSGKQFSQDEIIVIPPGDATDFIALEDTVTLVVKMPCVRGDKHSVDEG